MIRDRRLPIVAGLLAVTVLLGVCSKRGAGSTKQPTSARATVPASQAPTDAAQVPLVATSARSDSARPRSNAVVGLRLSAEPIGEARSSSLEPGSIAERAGLRVGDQILAVNDVRVRSPREGLAALQSSGAQNSILTIERDGKVQQIRLGSIGGASSKDSRIGVTLAGSEDIPGVIISSLTPGGPALDAGLRIGDRILAVDGRQVLTPRMLQQAIHRRQPGESVELRVERDGWRRSFDLLLADRKTLLSNAVRAARRPSEEWTPATNVAPSFDGDGYDYERVLSDPALRSVYLDFD